jgi:hypothetical protein
MRKNCLLLDVIWKIFPIVGVHHENIDSRRSADHPFIYGTKVSSLRVNRNIGISVGQGVFIEILTSYIIQISIAMIC